MIGLLNSKCVFAQALQVKLRRDQQKKKRKTHFRSCRKLTRDGRKPVRVVSFSGFGEGKGSRFDIFKFEN